MRWKPRFSLGSLVLFVLLIASGATLWWNWSLWAPVVTIVTETKIQGVGFSPSEKYYYIASQKQDESSKGDNSLLKVEIFDTASHKRVAQLATECFPCYQFGFLDGDRCFFAQGSPKDAGHPCVAVIWSIEDGKEVPHNTTELPSFEFIKIAIGGQSALVMSYPSKREILVETPSLKKICGVSCPDFANRWLHGDYVLTQDGDRPGRGEPKYFACLDMKGNRLGQVEITERGLATGGCLSQDRTLLLVHEIYNVSRASLLYEFPSGRLLKTLSISGTHSSISSDNRYVLYWDINAQSQHAMELSSNRDVLLPASSEYIGAFTDAENIYHGGRLASWRLSDLSLRYDLSAIADGEVRTSFDGWDIRSNTFLYNTKANEKTIHIFDGTQGKEIGVASRLRWSTQLPKFPYRAVFSNSNTEMMTFADFTDNEIVNGRACVFAFWRSDRFFAFKMPELWLTVFLLVAFVWNCIRLRASERNVRRPNPTT